MLFHGNKYKIKNQAISNKALNNIVIEKNYRINLKNIMNKLAFISDDSIEIDFNFTERQAAYEAMPLGAKIRTFEAAWNDCVATKLEQVGKSADDIIQAVSGAIVSLVFGATIGEVILTAAATLGVSINIICVRNAINRVKTAQSQWQ